MCHGDVADLVHGSAESRAVERWKNGQSAAAISRALERKNKTGVERIWYCMEGSDRRRAGALAALRFEEREDISRGIAAQRQQLQILMIDQQERVIVGGE